MFQYQIVMITHNNVLRKWAGPRLCNPKLICEGEGVENKSGTKKIILQYWKQGRRLGEVHQGGETKGKNQEEFLIPKHLFKQYQSSVAFSVSRHKPWTTQTTPVSPTSYHKLICSSVCLKTFASVSWTEIQLQRCGHSTFITSGYCLSFLPHGA